jgi:hypothetical protein
MMAAVVLVALDCMAIRTPLRLRMSFVCLVPYRTAAHRHAPLAPVDRRH